MFQNILQMSIHWNMTKIIGNQLPLHQQSNISLWKEFLWAPPKSAFSIRETEYEMSKMDANLKGWLSKLRLDSI